MLTTLVAGRLGVRIPTNNSRVLSPPASYMGLACQDGYIALRCKNFELYDNLRKISSNLFHFVDVSAYFWRDSILLTPNAPSSKRRHRNLQETGKEGEE